MLTVIVQQPDPVFPCVPCSNSDISKSIGLPTLAAMAAGFQQALVAHAMSCCMLRRIALTCCVPPAPGYTQNSVCGTVPRRGAGRLYGTARTGVTLVSGAAGPAAVRGGVLLDAAGPKGRCRGRGGSGGTACRCRGWQPWEGRLALHTVHLMSAAFLSTHSPPLTSC